MRSCVFRFRLVFGGQQALPGLCSQLLSPRGGNGQAGAAETAAHSVAGVAETAAHSVAGVAETAAHSVAGVAETAVDKHLCSPYTSQQWYTADAEITVPSIENYPETLRDEAVNRLRPGVGQNIARHAWLNARNVFLVLVSAFPVHSPS